ncbi:hypothetical protein J2Y45_002694 [Dyadobacter sp. BE34]|uniref:DUF4421 domain-containing protein n=1 Tax=Dyadobacter fermentans TaxID=94254 RepID=A0ABU1QV85_9BACT|nr:MULTISPECIES: hypothetical protein [Dyadobacter]MDR6804998.1 hypothetical protein [Dyadobacter fermentans]MDR7043243.1 hypothetical protein [Dyadobacter sp. BE242]MDR7197555.1 hypothetical protein [Dyadobacter sp. BE34]MDR7215012.1 hypothetical protein [Dyadobacter sp. BE31]MDR7262547.1 hypothetical protein [Dyadobacter sp. BE32]
MRQLLRLLMLLVACAIRSFAQDTTSVTFTEENSPVVEQRFIDRYENVFMTKVPTRKMFKLGYSSMAYNGIGFSAAFEYKVLPALSLEATLTSRTNRLGSVITIDRFERQLSGRNMFASIGSRWYFEMNKRIERQQSANNFSGSYLGIAYERSLAAIQSDRPRQHFSITYGFQSRFLANGFLDFSLGIYYVTPYLSLWGVGYIEPPGFTTRNAVIASRSVLGLAFGDWKRNGSGPLCDVLHCDYFVKQHFKIRLPEVNIGLNNQLLRMEVGYERKLGKSPLSVNLSIGNETSHSSYGGYSLPTVGEAQLRWYYLQKRQVRKGKASDNLSGLYAGSRFAYNYDRSVYRDYVTGGRYVYSFWNTSAGVLAGYQQRLFNKLYFDATVSYSGGSMQKRVFKVNYAELQAKAGIGFAL